MTKYKFAVDIFCGLDISADFFLQKIASIKLKTGLNLFDADDFIQYYTDLNREYRLFSLEDPFSEDDWNSWG